MLALPNLFGSQFIYALHLLHTSAKLHCIATHHVCPVITIIFFLFLMFLLQCMPDSNHSVLSTAFEDLDISTFFMKLLHKTTYTHLSQGSSA